MFTDEPNLLNGSLTQTLATESQLRTFLFCFSLKLLCLVHRRRWRHAHKNLFFFFSTNVKPPHLKIYKACMQFYRGLCYSGDTLLPTFLKTQNQIFKLLSQNLWLFWQKSIKCLETVSSVPGHQVSSSRQLDAAKICERLHTAAEPLRWLHTCVTAGQGQAEVFCDRPSTAREKLPHHNSQF